MAALDMNAINAILTGRATLDDYMSQDTGSGGAVGQSPAAQQYLSTFDPNNYMDPAIAAFQQSGGMAQDPKYYGDDVRAWAKQIGGTAQAAGKAGYGTYMDEQNLGLKQQAADAKYSTGDADFLALTMKGLTPDKIQQALTSGSKDDVDFLMETLGAVDKNGAADYSTTNIQRLAHLEQYHENLQADQAKQADTAAQKTRWSSLNPEARAKETYLRLTNPGQKVAVGVDGTAYYGQDAETQASKARASTTVFPFAENKRTASTANAARPGAARSATEDVRNLASAVAQGKGFVGQAVKWSPEGVKHQVINAAIDKTPGAARKGWHYLFG